MDSPMNNGGDDLDAHAGASQANHFSIAGEQHHEERREREEKNANHAFLDGQGPKCPVHGLLRPYRLPGAKGLANHDTGRLGPTP